MSFKRKHWTSMFGHDVGHFLSWNTYLCIWTFWLWNFDQSGSILHLYLSVCWNGVSCLSIKVRWSFNDINYLLLQSFVTQMSPDCLQSRLLQCHLGVRLVLETFVNSVLTPHFEMTDVHQCGKVICLSLCFHNDLLFAFNLIQLTLATFQAFPILSLSAASFTSWIFIAWGTRNKLAHQIAVSHPMGPFLRDVIYLIFW